MAGKKLLSALALGAAAALALTGCTNDAGGNNAGDSDTAADYPTKNITLVVPWNPGGDGDLSARALATVMEEDLGVSIIVENRPGAAGSIGWESVKQAPADGYTIAMGSTESVTLQFMDYDVKPDDFVFLGQATAAPGGIAVPADAPYETLDDLIDFAKANPGQLSYSSPGAGSVWDLPTHQLMVETGTEMSGVPFDGSAPSVQAAAAGHVDFTMNTVSLIAPHVESGTMKWLATVGEERHELFPDVPTATELGYPIVQDSWVGMKVAKDTPQDIVETLSKALTKAVESEKFADTVGPAQLVPTVRPYPEMDKWVRTLADGYEPLFERINAGS